MKDTRHRLIALTPLEALARQTVGRRRALQIGAGTVALAGLAACGYAPDDGGGSTGGGGHVLITDGGTVTDGGGATDGGSGGGGGATDAGSGGGGGATDAGGGGGGGATDAGSGGGGGSTDGGTTDAGAFCDPARDICIDLSNPANSVLTQIDGWGTLDIGTDTLVIVRTGASDFTVDSAVCTHQGCIVEYRASGPDLYCRCHGSDFALDGSVLRGPAWSPLRAYAWDFDGTILAIHL